MKYELVNGEHHLVMSELELNVVRFACEILNEQMGEVPVIQLAGWCRDMKCEITSFVDTAEEAIITMPDLLGDGSDE